MRYRLNIIVWDCIDAWKDHDEGLSVSFPCVSPDEVNPLLALCKKNALPVAVEYVPVADSDGDLNV